MTALFHSSSFTPKELTAMPLPKSTYFFPDSDQSVAPSPRQRSVGKRLYVFAINF